MMEDCRWSTAKKCAASDGDDSFPAGVTEVMSLLTRRLTSELNQTHWVAFILLFLGLMVVTTNSRGIAWALTRNRAYVLLSRGDTKYLNRAYELFNSALSQAKGSADSVDYGMGLAALQLDKLGTAENAAQQLSEKSQRRAMFAFSLGSRYFEVGTVAKAVEEWRHVLEIVKLLALQAGNLEAEGQIDRAEQLLLAAEKSSPGDYEVYAKLGDFYLRQGDSQSALNAYRRGAESIGGPGGAYLAGLAYELENEWQAALEAYKAATDLDDPEVYLRLGDLLYYPFKRLDEALSVFLRGLALEPQNPTWHQRIARVYADQGNLIEAERWYLEALRWYPDPGNWWVRNNLAHVYLKMGRLDRARLQLETSIGLQEKNVGAHRLLARVYMEGEQWDKAIAEFRTAIEQADPVDAAKFRHELALFYEQIGEVENAIREYQILLESNPEDAVARERLSALEGKKP